MVDRVAIYTVWAPESARWSPWVKPVLFSALEDLPVDEPPAGDDLSWLPLEPVVLVFDLNAADAVWLGLAAAGLGYRPVPLYNALPAPVIGSPAQVDVRPIMGALVAGASRLPPLPDDAPPVFLLHEERSIGTGGIRVFDNRSLVFTTDFPSANLLLSYGLRTVILVQTKPGPPLPDLRHTLAAWADGGLEILSKVAGDGHPPAPCSIPRPSNFRVVCYRVLEALGFRRNVLGGFGGYPPDLSAGG